MKLVGILLICLCLSGCYLIPKDVEFGQKKVEAVPVKSDQLIEKEKQAADYIHRKVNEAHDAALVENSSTNIVIPLDDARAVTGPLSASLGAPKTHWDGKSAELAASLEKENSKFDKKLAQYRKDIDEIKGKKVEGTGFIQMSWFTAAFGTIGLIILIYIAIKIIGMIYLPVGIGASAIKLPSVDVGNMVNQLIKGGELFKKNLDDVIEDPEIKEKIIETFRTSHMITQSPKNQEIIKNIT